MIFAVIFDVILAIAIVWLLCLFASSKAARVRRGQYHRQRELRKRLLGNYRMPVSLPSAPDPPEALGLSQLLSADQAFSVSAQQKYYALTVRSVSAITIAFGALVVSLASDDESSRFVLLMEKVEIVGLLFAGLFISLSRRANHTWMFERTKVELMRRFIFLRLVFPSFFVNDGMGGLTAAYFSESQRIVSKLTDVQADDFGIRVRQIWNDQRKILDGGRPDQVNALALSYYIYHRPLRQLMWFRSSRERLRSTEENRAKVLGSLYVSSLMLTTIKIGLAHWQFGPAFLRGAAAMLLLITGWAAAATALFIGQNLRSLSHRYNSQESSVKEWLAALPNLIDGNGFSQESARAILEFEDLMNDELIDWITVSHHDVVELAP